MIRDWLKKMNRLYIKVKVINNRPDFLKITAFNSCLNTSVLRNKSGSLAGRVKYFPFSELVNQDVVFLAL